MIAACGDQRRETQRRNGKPASHRSVP
jgi:hypothetical protein